MEGIQRVRQSGSSGQEVRCSIDGSPRWGGVSNDNTKQRGEREDDTTVKIGGKETGETGLNELTSMKGREKLVNFLPFQNRNLMLQNYLVF